MRSSRELSKFTVEIKSVNHRYFDVNIRMPKKLSFFEAAIRGVLKEYIQRGKVDVFIAYEDLTETNVSLKVQRGSGTPSMCGTIRRWQRQFCWMPFDLTSIRSWHAARRCFTMEEAAVDEEETLDSRWKRPCGTACVSILQRSRQQGRRVHSADRPGRQAGAAWKRMWIRQWKSGHPGDYGRIPGKA